MCGLFGVVASTGDRVTEDDLAQFQDIARKSQRRGKDASGLMIATADNEQCVIKATTSIGRLLAMPSVTATLASRQGSLVAAFGHTRLATHGSINRSDNNHPLISNNWTVVHNGWVTNHQDIRERFGAASTDPETDSFAINLVLEAWGASGTEEAASFLSILEGEITFIAWCTDGRCVAMSNVGNLYTTARDGRTFVASEPAFFPTAVRSTASKLPIGQLVELRRPEPGAGVGSVTLVEPARRQRRVVPAPTGADSEVDLARRLDIGYQRILSWTQSFDRCSTCVLPAHFPHADIDGSGRCVSCREYRPPSFEGLDSLSEHLGEQLGGHSGPVLVGLSGGRDSCYALHLVHSLGFEPVAFTYDWGLVTNEARENMARMCGKLGVEHVLVARDIEQVKRRLRGGLAAILRTTDLAIVPLLMSGDKSWMHWAQQIAKERGSAPIVMGTHRAESTGFKSALATGRRTRPTSDHHSFWKLQIGPLARMATRYATFGLREPGALPILYRDALPGAWHYYVRRQQIVLPFDYVPWDRELIESTIETEYGWSFGTSGTKWRAGDGTAVVYNLLYISGLGYSELETFLSNQIRSGSMTRSAAMSAIVNRPSVDLDALIGYLDFIGADRQASLRGFVDVVEDSPAFHPQRRS